MREHAFKYETLGTPGELPHAVGYIAPGTSVWDRNERRSNVLVRLLAYVFGGGWRG